MSGSHGQINRIANSDSSTKVNMMNMWRDSVETARLARTAPNAVATSNKETAASLDQKVKSGQSGCPTCAKRTYKDQSKDGAVSFKAGKSIASSTAGITVMNHEQEHVSANASDKSAAAIASSTTGLEYSKCAECGKTYVSGGFTKTTTRPASQIQKPKEPNSFNIMV